MTALVRNVVLAFSAWWILPVFADPPRFQPEKTHALIVGVLDWQQQSLATYGKERRQDVALRNQLLSMGVPKQNSVLLLDRDATLTAVSESLEMVSKRCTEESTLLVYYAGHGMYSGEQGVFANHDVDTERLEQTGWCHDDITRTIKDHFRGKRVLLFADCCFSGSLARVCKQLAESGIDATSLTSASPHNTSTSNWTFTLSLIDLLDGQPLADDNGDGLISIKEAAREVGDAMAHFERQASGFTIEGKASELILSRRKDHADHGKMISPFQRGQYVRVKDRKRSEPARIMDADFENNRIAVRFRDYSQYRTAWIDPSAAKPFDEEALAKIVPPTALSQSDALRKASMDGKYSNLQKSIWMPTDFKSYGAFHEWGQWSGSSWGHYKNLPSGYWVYVYPDWYIWAARQEPSED